MSIYFTYVYAPDSSPSAATINDGTTTGVPGTDMNKLLQTWIEKSKEQYEKLKEEDKFKLLAAKRDEVLEIVKSHEIFQKNKERFDEARKKIEEDERIQDLGMKTKIALIHAATTTITAADNFVKSERVQNAVRSEQFQKVINSERVQQVIQSRPVEIAKKKIADLGEKMPTETEGEDIDEAT